MKRLVSISLILCFLLTFTPAFSVFAADTKTSAVYSDTEELFMSLGIIKDGEYEASAGLTRAEFATIIARTTGLIDESSTSQWQEENFGAETSGTIVPAGSVFLDVDPANENYKAILAVRNAGYMSGIGGGYFAPDLQLVTSEATKVIVDVLGYDKLAEAHGGYPKGYNAAASRLKLLNGVSSASNELITMEDVITIIYNAMEVGVGRLQGITDDYIITEGSSDSFMREVMGIDKIEGQITDNGVSAIDSSSSVSAEYMIIDGIKVKYTKATEKYRSYLGRSVIAYYDISEEAENSLLYVALEDEAVEISAEDFISYSNGTIRYYDGTRTKSVTPGKTARMIYNGAYVKNYTAEDFDIEDGKITVIEEKNGSIILVESYKTMMVSMISADAGNVYNKLNFVPIGNQLKTVNLLQGEDYESVSISDTNGKAMELADITVGSILNVMLSKNGEYAKVIAGGDVIKDVTIYSYDGDAYETSAGEIEVSTAFAKAKNKEEIDYNKAYTLYMNSFGKLVWAEASGDIEDLKIGILLKTGDTSTGLNTSYAARLYTPDGKITDFAVDKKIILNKDRVDTLVAFEEMDQNIGKPVLYNSKDGVLTEVTTPAPYGTDGSVDKRGWYKVTHDIEYYEQGNMSDADWNAYRWRHFYIYNNAGNGAAYTVRTDGTQTGPLVSILTHSDDTKFYKIPTNEEDFDNEKFFGIVSKPTYPENSYFAIDGYSRTAGDPCPEVIVQRENAKGSGSPSENSAFLITKVKQGVNSEDEAVTILEGYDLKQGSATSADRVVNVDAVMLGRDNTEIDATKPATEVGPRSYKELEAGDIIRFSTNALGEINTMRISFDYDTKYTAGRQGDYDTASYGPVMSINDRAMKVMQNGTVNPEDVDFTNMDHVVAARVYPLKSSSVVIIAEKDARGSLTFRMGSVSDIIAYENTLVPGEYDHVATVAHWYGGFLATVIFR